MVSNGATTLHKDPLTSLLSDKRIRTASGARANSHQNAQSDCQKEYQNDCQNDCQNDHQYDGPNSSHSARYSTHKNSQEVNLCFGIRGLDDFFANFIDTSRDTSSGEHSASPPKGHGLAFGTLLEMGIPFGNGGRRLLALLLAAATRGACDAQKHWCLWISARQQPAVYPPAWQALGVDLNRLRFASSECQVGDLRAVFLDDFFRVIVIDHPNGLKPDEHIFLAQCARRHHKIIVVARDTHLSASDSNTAARYRLNVSRPARQNILELLPVRGLHRHLRLSSFFQHPNFKIFP
jgi:hypothetical protein